MKGENMKIDMSATENDLKDKEDFPVIMVYTVPPKGKEQLANDRVARRVSVKEELSHELVSVPEDSEIDLAGKRRSRSVSPMKRDYAPPRVRRVSVPCIFQSQKDEHVKRTKGKPAKKKTEKVSKEDKQTDVQDNNNTDTEVRMESPVLRRKNDRRLSLPCYLQVVSKVGVDQVSPASSGELETVNESESEKEEDGDNKGLVGASMMSFYKVWEKDGTKEKNGKTGRKPNCRHTSRDCNCHPRPRTLTM